MKQSLSILENCFIGCGECGELFESTLPAVVNTNTDPELVDKIKNGELLQATCTKCGHTANAPACFLLHDPDKNILWFVVSFELYLRYPYTKRAADRLIEKYINKVGDALKESVRKLDLQIVPVDIFLHRYQEEKPGVGLGMYHFVPFPKFKDLPDASGSRKDDHSNTAIYIIENNYPENLETIIDLIDPLLKLGQYYIPTKKQEREQAPVATFGIVEILLGISSTFILPILVGVISNILSTIVLEKGKNKENLQKQLSQLEKEKYQRLALEKARVEMLLRAQNNNLTPTDEINFTIIDNATGKSYRFAGTVADVFKDMTAFRKKILLSMYLPGNCHCCLFLGNHFIDLSVSEEANHISDFESLYKKHFAPSSKVRLIYGDDTDYFYKQASATKLSRLLISEKRYEEALRVLFSAHSEQRLNNTDLLFNIGFCLKMLGFENEACDIFEQVLIQTINFPSIENISNIAMLSSDELTKEDLSLDDFQENALSIILEANRLSYKNLQKWKKQYGLKDSDEENKFSLLKKVSSFINGFFHFLKVPFFKE